MQYGYSPFVVKDACGDRHASVNDSNVKNPFFSELPFFSIKDTCSLLSIH